MDILKYISYGSSESSSGSSWARCPSCGQFNNTSLRWFSFCLCCFSLTSVPWDHIPSKLPTFLGQTIFVSGSAFRGTPIGGQRSTHFSRMPIRSSTYYSASDHSDFSLHFCSIVFILGTWWDPKPPSFSKATTDWTVLKRLGQRSYPGRVQPTSLSQSHS